MLQYRAPIVIRFGITLLELDRPSVSLASGGQVAQLLVHVAEFQPELGIAWSKRTGFLKGHAGFAQLSKSLH